MPDYQNGKIYKIVNSVNDVIYIGSTTSALSVRMRGHRQDAKKRTSGYLYPAMRDIGIEHFKIKLIKPAPCKTLGELHDVEYQIMQEMKSDGYEFYNVTFDGRNTAESRAKLSVAKMGHVVSTETRRKLSAAQMGKTGTLHPGFKRGSIYFEKSGERWRFHWYVDGKAKSKGFSIKKYGNDAKAKVMAEAYQDEIFPL